MSSNMLGVKHDQGKVRAGLMPGKGVNEVMKVMTFGANKYTAGGWKTVPQARERYTDALVRHLLAHLSGEVVDPESGLPHMAHLACNAVFLLDAPWEEGAVKSHAGAIDSVWESILWETRSYEEIYEDK